MERNLGMEQNALKTYRQKYGGQNPDIYNDPKQRAQFYQLSYPTENDLPNELKGTVDYSLLSTGLSSPLRKLEKEVETTKKGVEELGQPNSALRILQEAIRTKAGFKELPLGKSEIFKKAGVGGMGALSQSLNMRGQELEMNRTDFHNTINEMAGTYKDMAGVAMFKYEQAVNAYDKERNYIETIDSELRQYENAIKLYKRKGEIDRELQGIEGIGGMGAKELLELDSLKLKIQKQIQELYGTEPVDEMEAKTKQAEYDLLQDKLNANQAKIDKGKIAQGLSKFLMQEKINFIDSIIENTEGLRKTVGTGKLGRTPIKGILSLGLWHSKTALKFSSSVKQLIAKETIDTLVALKERGGTLGALSNEERIMLQQAATQIGSWQIKDTGRFNIDEKSFTEELKKIQRVAKKWLSEMPEDEVKEGTGTETDYSQSIQGAIESGYNNSEIIDYLNNDPNMSEIINEAREGNYNDDEIIEYLKEKFSSNTNEIKKISQAIGQYESGNNYKIRGKVIPSGQYKGERALGKYQIMPGNLPSWSREALGRVVSEEEFLNNPNIQDKIAEYKMAKIYEQYGTAEDVASVWFTGQPMARAGNVKDALGTSAPTYIKNILSIYNKLG